jgi:hypothetical protein
MKGLSDPSFSIYVGFGLGDGLAGGVGDAGGDGGGEGLGGPDGLGFGDALGELLGQALGDAPGDAVGDAAGELLGQGVGEGQGPCVPVRKISCESHPLPCTIPEGVEYQSRMLRGSALTKRRIMVWPTLSPKARIVPPPPLGAVLPTQTPTTMSGL